VSDPNVPSPTLLSADGDPGGQVAVLSPDLGGESLAAYALRHGLRPSAAQPRVLAYLRELWLRRHFVMAFATARNIAMYTEAKLGQIWQILTPLLNAGGCTSTVASRITWASWSPASSCSTSRSGPSSPRPR
jgi:hypothetical protein